MLLTTKREKTRTFDLVTDVTFATVSDLSCRHRVSEDNEGCDVGTRVGLEDGKCDGLGVGRFVRLTPRASGDEVDGAEVGCDVGCAPG